ncbi:MAG: hypothetical protein ACI9DF_002966, partial [Verrucomicrobiales bacterium]
MLELMVSRTLACYHIHKSVIVSVDGSCTKKRALRCS